MGSVLNEFAVVEVFKIGMVLFIDVAVVSLFPGCAWQRGHRLWE